MAAVFYLLGAFAFAWATWSVWGVYLLIGLLLVGVGIAIRSEDGQ